jgi:group II intron reverse transcriptase/maturase
MLNYQEVREMRTAEMVLNIIRDRGQRKRPLERLYRHLYNRELYLLAYGKIYRNKGAMTPGANPETVDGMSLENIDTIIEALRWERYRWTPVRRQYIPKNSGKLRKLGLPTWSDKLLQEVLRLLLEAYYEPQFSSHSHGFRSGRGCHTALREIQRWDGVKWFIEGDIRQCFDTIDFTVLLDIMREQIHDNRFIRLIENCLRAGYLEEWQYVDSYSGVPQGGILSPCLSNLVLDRLDKYVEQTLITANTQSRRRKTYPPYVALTKAAWKARKTGDWQAASRFSRQAQTLPSRDPQDPNFRRLKFCRYADDFILGFTGPKAEAEVIKEQLATFLREELKLELNTEKTLITHARTGQALFLGYEIHTLHANDKHDHRGQRCINGAVGLRVPRSVIQKHCSKYMRRGKPHHLMQRTNDSTYSIIAQYQTEYRGVVQYYRLAYNLHQLSRLKWVMQQSLVRTLAKKLKISKAQVYKRFKATHQNEYGTYKVLAVTVDREPGQKPLVARFGGVPLRYNRWAAINDAPTKPIWSKRSEVVQRLLAQKCELCGATNDIEVHHIRKLADLKRYGQANPPKWVQQMAARRRKTLVVCLPCHHTIQYGRYDGPKLSN